MINSNEVTDMNAINRDVKILSDWILYAGWQTAIVASIVFFVFNLQTTATADGKQLEPKSETEHESSTEPKVLERVVGKVHDSAGEPIEGAAVKVELYSFPKTGKRDRQSLKTCNAVTDKNGAFEVQCEQKVPADRQLQFSVAAKSDLHVRNSRVSSVSESNIENHTYDIGALKLLRAIRITGRVAAPDQNNPQPIDTVVQISKIGSIGDENDSTNFYISVACDKDGNFETMVPENSRISLSFAAENYAPTFEQRDVKRALESGDEEIQTLDLGDFKLRAGVSVVGTVRKRDGTTLAGAVVAILQFESDDISADSLMVSSTKTDRKGKFRLSPHLGKCWVSVVEHAASRKIVNGICQGLNADGEVPLFDIVEVNLEGKTGEHELNLMAAESVAISGMIRFEDGTPLAGAKVVYGYDLSGEPINTGVVDADEQGKYEFAIPKGRIPLIQFRERWIDDVRFDASISGTALAAHRKIFSKADGKRADESKIQRGDRGRIKSGLGLPPRTYRSRVKCA